MKGCNKKHDFHYVRLYFAARRWTIKNPRSQITCGFLYFFGFLKTPIWYDGRSWMCS